METDLDIRKQPTTLEESLTTIHRLIVERLYEWANGKKAPPTKATLIITNQCDLNCLFCRGAFGSKDPDFYKGELSKEEWTNIVKEGVELGIKEWAITGGEPFIKADTVIGVIRAIRKKSPSSIINSITSGSSFSLEVANELVQLGCNSIEVGIDGPNAETHDFLRGSKGSFKKATNSVKYLAYAKKKFGKEKPVIILKTVLNSKNYDKLPEMVSLAHSLGANVVEVIPLRVYEENRSLIEENNLKLTYEQKGKMEEIWEKVEKNAKEHGVIAIRSFTSDTEGVSEIIKHKKPETNNSSVSMNRVLFCVSPFYALIGGVSEIIKHKKPKKDKSPDSVNKFLSVFCYTPFYSLVIGPNGFVSPCVPIPPSDFKNLIFLNLRERGLKEIWYGDFFNLIRDLSIGGKPISEKCKSCGMVRERKIMLEELGKKSTGE